MKKPLETWRRNLYVIWLAQFIAMIGMSLVIPFLPFFIRELGVTDLDDVARWSGLAYSGPFFIAFFLIPVWGYLGDRYGQKIMVVRAIFGLAISQVLVGLSQNVEMLFFFRMLQGAISGFISASLALVSASTPSDKSGYAIGILQTATSSGNVFGPLVGGSLADAIGYRPLFFIVAGLCLIGAVLIITLVKEVQRPKPATRQRHSLLSNYQYAFRSSQIRIALAAILMTQMAILLIRPIFALYVEYLEPQIEYIATLAGALFSVAGLFMVVSSPWWGRRNDVKSYKTNLRFAIFGAAVAYFAQGFMDDAYHLVYLRALQGFCMGGILPTLYSYVSKNTAYERRGGIMGIAASFYILASAIGPSFGGYIAATVGVREAFFVTGTLLIASFILVQMFFVDLKGSDTAGHEEDQTRPVDISHQEHA